MRTNIQDVEDTVIIVGRCLKYREPKGFEKLKEISNNIYELCLEETRINMAITKIGGMLRTGKVQKIILQQLINLLTVFKCIIFKMN